jgi:methylamine--corrinoid protein Co-methyltransferase
MINLFDILDRSQSGEKIVDEKQWDIRVWKRAVELSKEYKIKYDPKYAIMCDDELADRCFEAAVKLLCEVGVFNIGTKRVVNFEEEEIRKALSQQRDKIVLGEGRDRFILAHRHIDAHDDVKVMAGHLACTDEIGPKLYQAMAEVQSLDIIEGFNFYGEHAGRTMEGIVHETLGTKATISWTRRAIARAGRPGLHILYYPVSPNPTAMVSCMDPESGIRKTDAVEISPIPELKIENNLLAVAIATTEYGAFVNSDVTSILYGFGGGPDENAIIGTAQSIQVYLTYRVDYNNLAQALPIDVEGWSLPAACWSRSINSVAMARNVKSPCFVYVSPGPEPNHENRWRELAAQTMMAVASGSHIDVIRPIRPYRPNLLTPLEIEFCSEIANAMVKNKMSREKTNEIIMNGLAPKYKPMYDVPTRERYPLLKGKPFEELYDLNTLKPNREHLDSYHAARKELGKLGVEFEW